MPPLHRFQQNGSLVVAKTEADVKVLRELITRGDLNGVRNLRIVDREELREMEPHIHPDAIAALYSPDAGTITPYEYTIALAENAVDNGVELRLRREVTSVDVVPEEGKGGEEEGEGGGKKGGGRFRITVAHWEPEKTARRLNKEARGGISSRFVRVLLSALTLVLALCASTAAPLYVDEHLYNIQCSEIFTLRNEKLHTEA
jgi:glycine/D-amino acid oxidase-like deaminating enzyme